MNNKQKLVLDAFKKYLDENGIKTIFVLQKLGISESALSRWRSGKRNIGKKNFKLIIEYINFDESCLD